MAGKALPASFQYEASVTLGMVGVCCLGCAAACSALQTNILAACSCVHSVVSGTDAEVKDVLHVELVLCYWLLVLIDLPRAHVSFLGCRCCGCGVPCSHTASLQPSMFAPHQPPCWLTTS